MWRLLPLLLLVASACTRPRVHPIDGLTYIQIPAGAFSFGCPPDETECYEWAPTIEAPQVKTAFWIGQTEVTQRAYKYVLGTNPSAALGEQRPVDHVSWNDAKRYCQALGMRLPKAMEWEYAARGGVSAIRYDQVRDITWYDANSGFITHEVRRTQPNGFGLYEMVGNMVEWVADPYTADPTQDRHQLRGGVFKEASKHIVGSNMNWAPQETTDRHIGFRCAADTME